MKCKKCGGETWIKPEEVGVDRNNVPIYHRIAYCDSCMLKFDLDEHSNYVSDKKKESKRGIWGLVLSFFSSNILIALVSAFLCISALSKKDEKSVCGVLGLVLCALLTFGTIVGGGNESANDIYENNKEIVTEMESEKNTEIGVAEALIYDSNNVLIYIKDIKKTSSGYDLNFYIENNSELNLGFNAHSYAINKINTGNNIYDMDCGKTIGRKWSIVQLN